MILDNVNPNDLFPTEQKGPTLLGDMDYPVRGEVKTFEAGYVATSERLILNVDMDGEFYYRNINYSEIEAITLADATLTIRFAVGAFPMRNVDVEKAEAFKAYIEEHMD